MNYFMKYGKKGLVLDLPDTIEVTLIQCLS